jgi:hypothetical protein
VRTSSGTTKTATYTYLANSPLVSQIAFQQSTTTRMTTTKQWDYLNRLQAVSSAPSAGFAVNFNYSYNNANQRIRSTLADGSYTTSQWNSAGITGNPSPLPLRRGEGDRRPGEGKTPIVSVNWYKVNRHSSLGPIWTDFGGDRRHEDLFRPCEFR